MASGVIQPTRVYPPGTPRTVYQTYNTRYIPPPGPPAGGPAASPYTPPPKGPGWVTRTWNRVPSQPQRVTTHRDIPAVFGDRRMIMTLWFIAMILVGFDEWHNYGVLPRPVRLWDTSLFYGLCCLAGMADPLLPLVNLFAVGMTLALGYKIVGGTWEASQLKILNATPPGGGGSGGVKAA